VRPAEPRKPAATATEREVVSPEAVAVPALPTPATPLADNPPRPIGPEALRRLREAIQSGEYPNDTAVRAGLERLIRRPD
jgi:hypothetical protein